MEGVGRLGRSSTRYGPTIVFTGPIRKWKKKWIHVLPPNTTTITTTNNNNNNGDSTHLVLYKWAPISSQSQSQSQNGDEDEGKEDGEEAEDGEPPRRKIKYIPIALLEEQKNSPEENADESVETDSNSKVDHVNGNPDINDVPMEDNQVSEETNVERQDLNESALDLNARHGDDDLEEPKDQAQ